MTIPRLTIRKPGGFRLFVRKAGCASCHLVNGQSAAFTDDGFHVTGVGFGSTLPTDRGRGAITGNIQDDYAFKTPSLRGVAQRPFLMHRGNMTSLRQVLEFYNERLSPGRS